MSHIPYAHLSLPFLFYGLQVQFNVIISKYMHLICVIAFLLLQEAEGATQTVKQTDMCPEHVPTCTL